MDEIQVIQNSCIKAMGRLPRHTPTTYLYSISMLTIEKLALVQRLVHLYKIVHSVVKNSFGVSFNNEIHEHATRSGTKLHIDGSHPSLVQSMIEYNGLDEETRSVNSVTAFKSRISIGFMKGCDKFEPISPFVYFN